ncbi:GNAT family N-acetyltransferase [Agromyces tardus]|jgi:GNAT superfamily N-acetyltransferase|uniref:GNAT family N-acetyltransferase n=1 Tax=Agromyces tardus TaxID=2583849 RepID=A0A3M8AGF4_9MICO|nr:GNAT family N-acetyltransferase [Agromyces tardus]RNB50231.1 GNAT family N-acetyltransferase [Agromyces tardus]
MHTEIRPAGDDDFFGWLPLFDAYCRFYETDLDDAKALIVWNWLRDEANPLQALLAVDEEGTPIGLAHYRSAPQTLTASVGIVLDDLFVDEAHRRSGVARALIEHVRERAAELGTGGVSWVTAADNTEAQRLYDELATRTTWVTYEMSA